MGGEHWGSGWGRVWGGEATGARAAGKGKNKRPRTWRGAPTAEAGAEWATGAVLEGAAARAGAARAGERELEDEREEERGILNNCFGRGIA